MELSDSVKAALEIVKAQASVRTMTADEIMTMARNIAAGIESMQNPAVGEAAPSATPAMDPKKAIRETAITCLECGKAMKIITAKHLASHGLTPAEYRAKYGYKKDQALASKTLARERRKKMQDMRLWERRKKPAKEKAA